MQNEWWMRPALQKNEAVLLPALPRRLGAARLLSRCAGPAQADAGFQPVEREWQAPAPPLQLSTYVRPRGSMAGRSVLRAAGIRREPWAARPCKRRF